MKIVPEDKVEKADEKIIMGNGARETRCNKGLKKRTEKSLKRQKRKRKMKERELDRQNERGKKRRSETSEGKGRRINVIATRERGEEVTQV